MNFHDFFRGFIGLNPRFNGPGNGNDDPVNKFRNPPWGDDPDEDDDFDELYNDYRGGHGNNFGFNMFTGDIMQMHKFFEQQMNEMMKSFGSLGVSGALEFPQGPLEFPERENEGRTKDPRNRYLKTEGDEPRFSASRIKTDSDLDDRINSDGIAALFKKDTEGERSLVPAAPRTFSKSFTSRVIINNNGKVEETVKEWKSDGSQRETVRRHLGDKSHSLTTVTESSGEVCQHEEFVNFDQDSLPNFNKKWSSSGGSTSRSVTLSPRDQEQVSAENRPPSADNILSSLWSLLS